jgi:biopolymer transport protein ExbD
MADMGEGGGGHEKGGKKRAKKGSTRVDMTPLVDLAFLLLTFFVLTSTFSKAKVMQLTYPAKPKVDQPKPKPEKINNGITFLLSENKIFYYEGQYYSMDNPGPNGPTQLVETNFGPGEKGVRKLLADKNKVIINGKAKLDAEKASGKITDEEHKKKLIEYKKGHINEALKVLIKTDDKAICKNFIDLIDELRINQVVVIAPVDMLVSENELLKAKIK